MWKLAAEEDHLTLSPVGEATDRCGLCGNDLRAKARFCDVCGAPVSPKAATAERKQVTVLFADLVGSMRLAAALDAERLQSIMNDLFNRASAVVQRYQGTVDKFTGDGLMALFGAPLALEDHALRACVSALEIQSVVDSLAAEVLRADGVVLQLRVGLNSGEVVAGAIGSGAGRYTAVGHPVGMAQRMEVAAPAGGVLCSLSTARLVEDATRLGAVENVAVKGAEDPVPARRLLAVDSERKILGRAEGLMLGRDAELERLLDLVDRDGGHFVGVAGPPGVGKTRLVSEFAAVIARQKVEVIVARCDAHATTLAFHALSRFLRAMFEVNGMNDADAREFIAAQCGDAFPGRDSADAQILFDAMGIGDLSAPPLQVGVDGRRRRLVAVMTKAAQARPARTVFILEDAHWIDAPSDDVLADFAATLDKAMSSFVAIYRSDFRGALRERSEQNIELEPLSREMTFGVVRQLLGADQSLAHLVEQIAVAAVGNPFFAEEIVRDLVSRGTLTGSRGGYRLVGGVNEITVPPTVQAVLAARIDRLPVESKSILNAAAVIGATFDVDSLHDLLADIKPARLAELVSAELIDQIEFVPRQRYCFHHPLVRSVAYESQLTSARAQAHRRLAAAVEARDPGAADENAALIAAHLDAAGESSEAYRWHLRAADWLRLRDLPAARDQWICARRIADGLHDDRYDVTAMRIAPRTMLLSTALYVGDDEDADDQYREFRHLTVEAADPMSYALGTAGRIISLSLNHNRVPDAMVLAAELEETLPDVDCDAPTMAVILIAVAFAHFTNCDFDAAKPVIQAVLSLPHERPTMEVAVSNSILGYMMTCEGDSEHGRWHSRKGIEQARTLHPVNSAVAMTYWAIHAALGLYEVDERVEEEMCRALERAESFGDICGVIAAQAAYGTALLRARNSARDVAINILKQARTNIENRNIYAVALATVAVDLAMEAARCGELDEAIDDLRKSFALQLSGGFQLLAGYSGESLVELLIQRGTADDIAEAQSVVAHSRARRASIPAMDLWWLRSRAMLAKTAGDVEGYADLAGQYLELCIRLDARGRIDKAREMLSESVATPS